MYDSVLNVQGYLPSHAGHVGDFLVPGLYELPFLELKTPLRLGNHLGPCNEGLELKTGDNKGQQILFVENDSERIKTETDGKTRYETVFRQMG